MTGEGQDVYEDEGGIEIDYILILLSSTQQPPTVHNILALLLSLLPLNDSIIFREMTLNQPSSASSDQASLNAKAEAQPTDAAAGHSSNPESAYKSLGWLDRLLAVWILLAMVIGILLGNFVPGVEAALHRGDLAGVSLPIGSS